MSSAQSKDAALVPSRPQTQLGRAVARAMQGRAGTAVVLEVASGKILAAYHPEVAARRLVHPGSTLKTFTLLALLESGKLKSEDSIVCPIELTIGGQRLDCSHARQPAPLDATTALALSCNRFFAAMSVRLVDEDLNRSFVAAGLTAQTGLRADEVSGVVRPSPTSERRQLKALGQGDIEVTPLGLVAAYRRLVLRRKQAGASPALVTVFQGLEKSATQGLAMPASPAEISVAGKTGTASASEGAWTHAWFVGYAPAQDPEIVLVVFLEHGRGSRDAAPIACRIFAAYATGRRAQPARP